MKSLAKWLLFLFFSASVLYAQSSKTSLRGTVTDASGAAVPGTQVTLDNKTTNFHAQRTADATGDYQFLQIPPGAGIVDQPALSFAPSGQARGLKPYWNMEKNNIAPRLAIAFAPDSSTSIRAGFGMYYSHFGEGIVNSFSPIWLLLPAGREANTKRCT